MTRPPLLVVSGPSGVGKGSVVAGLRERCPRVWLSISTTTRPPRPGERHGVDYFFVSPEQFRRQLAAGGFLEHAEYAGNQYGTARAPVLEALDQGRPVVLEIELAGARQVRRSFPDADLVMIVPPSIDELRRRLSGRGTEGTAELARRLDVARTELAAVDEFDHVIRNDEIGRTADELVHLLNDRPCDE